MMKIIELFTIPIVILNALSAIIGCIWLAIIGEWTLLGIGVVLIFTSHWILSMLMLPGMAISFISVWLMERKNLLMYVFGYLSNLYTNILIVGWCLGSFIVCTSYYAPIEGNIEITLRLIPYLLWSWSMALGPWQFFASKEPDNEYSIMTTYVISVFYLLTLISSFLVDQIPVFSVIVSLSALLVLIIILPIYNVYMTYKMESNPYY